MFDIDINKPNGETEYGEPQWWIEIKDGRSIEITHETEGLEDDEYYYSITLHANEREYEDHFQDTLGVISREITHTFNEAVTKAQELSNRPIFQRTESII